MKNTFKISTKYWQSLNDNEKYFLQTNAINHGVQYCKRILTLTNNSFEWDYNMN